MRVIMDHRKKKYNPGPTSVKYVIYTQNGHVILNYEIYTKIFRVNKKKMYMLLKKNIFAFLMQFLFFLIVILQYVVQFRNDVNPLLYINSLVIDYHVYIYMTQVPFEVAFNDFIQKQSSSHVSHWMAFQYRWTFQIITHYVSIHTTFIAYLDNV